ncbi:hypothetical protein [Alteraurantiacibacter palmitatis]|uniref:Secreted protein n=1 Tax=Alteraurantiacibacter palmitatis TaxID=2054628 RepID=A0ABV7E8N9_9SPHN
MRIQQLRGPAAAWAIGFASLAASALAPATAFSPTAQAQSADQPGGQCTTQTVARTDFALDEIPVFELQRREGRNTIVPAGAIARSRLPESFSVRVCGGYAQFELDGRNVLMRRSSFAVTCTCNVGQQREAGVPGAGTVRMCPAAQCPPRR